MNNYPNVPATLLPKWCKKGTDNGNLVYYPERHKIRRRMGKWYSKFWITDEYSTSGVKISDAIKPPLVGTSVVMLHMITLLVGEKLCINK